ncbi:MAG: sulfotransferase, partial [Candidatus Hodarchaeota archaeon]
LLINQNATRYLAKNNYNVARMEYIQKLFPDVKFICIIRDPFNHIASLAKQDRVLKEVELENSLLLDWTKIIGHREFGSARVCINLDNLNTIQRIRLLWNQKNTYIEGWAVYWDEVYSYILKKLRTNPKLAKASLIIRYEDLCKSPEEIIDKILEHIEVNPNSFKETKKHYCRKLHEPTYYNPKYTKKEQEKITHITKETAETYGYVL